MGNAVTISAANMRSGAGIFYGVVTTLAAGTEVTILGKELEWFKCQAGSATGYITQTLLRVTDPAVEVQYNPVKSNYQQLATYTTRFTSDVNRNHNIELAACKTSVVVKAGASFSFNTCTGNSTLTSNGWRMSIILVNGQREQGVGGGCCQVSSTIYSCVKQLSGITILERRPHSVPVGYVPVSGEAMVNYGTSDFRFRNDTGSDVFVYGLVDHVNGTLTETLYRINAFPTANVVVDGKQIPVNVAPMIIDDRVYIELRSLFEYLGYKVDYNAQTTAITMTKGTDSLTLESGAASQSIVRVQNGKKTVTLIPYPIKTVSDRTMFALRFAGELLGYDVGWDADTRTATLSKPKA